MGITASFDPRKIVPNSDIFLKAIIIGLNATIVQFILDFFGLTHFLDFIPEGFKLFVFVVLSIYLTNLLVIKFNGREVV